jgi:hypothetical protein
MRGVSELPSILVTFAELEAAHTRITGYVDVGFWDDLDFSPEFGWALEYFKAVRYERDGRDDGPERYRFFFNSDEDAMAMRMQV